MRTREKQVHDRETENHNGEIKNAKLRGARSAPARIARKTQIKDIGDENKQRDDVFGIVTPHVAGEAVDPDVAEGRADGDGDNANQNAALTHTIEQIERRQSPYHSAYAMLVKEALFAQVDEAEHAGQAERCVGQDAQRDVERKDDSVGGRSRESVRWRQLRYREKGQHKWQNESADRPLAVEQFEAEIGERQQPAEK